MSVLTGITNANEFYSNHYLDAILKDDIKGVGKRWKDLEAIAAEQSADKKATDESDKSPPKQLAGL